MCQNLLNPRSDSVTFIYVKISLINLSFPLSTKGIFWWQVLLRILFDINIVLRLGFAQLAEFWTNKSIFLIDCDLPMTCVVYRSFMPMGLRKNVGHENEFET